MGYSTTITEVGMDAAAFLAQNMAITFSGEAPEALRPFCYLTAPAEFTGQLTIGQHVVIGDQHWHITALGDLAQQNLAALGHVTFVFDGADTPKMSGAVHLAGVDEDPALGEGVQVVFRD